MRLKHLFNHQCHVTCQYVYLNTIQEDWSCSIFISVPRSYLKPIFNVLKIQQKKRWILKWSLNKMWPYLYWLESTVTKSGPCLNTNRERS